MSESPTVFATIGLLGFGTMGTGIAQVLSTSGRKVIALDTNWSQLEAGAAAVSASLDEAITRGAVDEEDKHAILARITTTTDISELAGVDAVIESITEKEEAKTALLREVAAVVGRQIPILTNTSALSVTELAAALPNPARVAGLHFFHPAPVQSTVEVVRALETDSDLVETLVEFVSALADKNAIVVKDRPGFLINSLLLPYLNDVITEYDHGLATAADIDLALELGLGYKRGPFQMIDAFGLDDLLNATDAAYHATADPRYAPPQLLRHMVAAGRCGDKHGHGFRSAPITEEN